MISNRSIAAMARLTLAAVIAGAVIAPSAYASGNVDMFTTSGCSCCVAWAKHLRSAGHTVTVRDVATGELARIKLAAGIPALLAACHTAKIGGFAIEGHVPVREIERLLAERPDAVGLAVPGMPIGSPGMEVGSTRAAYDVLLVRKDGTTEVYASYAAIK